MANKATVGKVSSTLKAGSPSNASLKSVSKSRTKIPKRQATVTLVSTGKQVKNAEAAARTVMTVPTSRKAVKSIAVEPVQKPPKKATQKTAPLGSVSSSSNAVAKETKNVTKIPKQLKTKSARNPKNTGRAPAGKQDITGQEAREADTSLVTEAAELTQLMAFDTDGARLRDQFSEEVADSSIKIFQIYYHERQSPFLDPAFEPYDNAGDGSPLLEFNVFTKLLQSKEVQDAKLWGALSWKFGQKTGISGAQFKKEIASNPGYDVYFCNPHAETEALYHNLWLQGETAHPNFLALCKEIFEVAGLSTELLTEIQPSSNFATANYFVATPAFWKRYAAFVSRVLLAANKKLSSTARSILFSSTADPNGVHADASYIPFVVERLFSVFLRTDGREFLAYKISPKAPDEQINVHLKLLGEMRNVAFRTKSVWMASCWVNYRNLYFTNAYGAPWAKRYLRSITPHAIVFAPDADNITFEAPAK
jgi:hypothetical protein